ncbi:hypothetical protein ACA910_012408 [Epithemia clementina (nom. ined.)]
MTRWIVRIAAAPTVVNNGPLPIVIKSIVWDCESVKPCNSHQTPMCNAAALPPVKTLKSKFRMRNNPSFAPAVPIPSIPVKARCCKPRAASRVWAAMPAWVACCRRPKWMSPPWVKN